jgi:hypothetical protein
MFRRAVRCLKFGLVLSLFSSVADAQSLNQLYPVLFQSPIRFISGSNTQSATTSVAALAPAGIQANDIEIACGGATASSGTVGALTPPSGWNTIIASGEVDSETEDDFGCFWHLVAPGRSAVLRLTRGRQLRPRPWASRPWTSGTSTQRRRLLRAAAVQRMLPRSHPLQSRADILSR